jgi:choline monooxygenase
MADLGSTLCAVLAHTRCSPQLPPSAYFDDALYQREMELVFGHAPRYVGHALSVPKVGDYASLQHEGEGRVLRHTAQGIRLMSNVCRHRQAIMLRGRGHTGANVVCPVHRWTYDAQGQLLGAPHFAQDPCLHLSTYPTREYQGLIFEDNGRDVAADLAQLGGSLDLKGYVLGHTQLQTLDYNWKTFIEVYLDDYHIAAFHPGLSQLVSCADLRWEFGPHYSVQTLGANPSATKAGTEVYREWQDAIRHFQNGKPPQQGAIWLTYYPHIMVERYPQAVVISTLHPHGPQKTTNLVEFFYPEEVAAFEPELMRAQQAAYFETCAEDDEIALRIDAGRRALWERGDFEIGPYQSPMEDGMEQFHRWYRQAMHLP